MDRKIVFVTYPWPFRHFRFKYFKFPNEIISICLGHEIHITRIIVLKELTEKKLSNDDIIVTSTDRKFLYNKIFKTVLDFKELQDNEEKYKNAKSLYYTKYASLVSVPEVVNIRFFPETESPEFVRLAINEIDYYNDLNIKNTFVIFHVRNLIEHDMQTNTERNDIIETITKVIPSNVDIYIFCNQNFEYEIKLKRINRVVNIVSELRLYASLLKNEKCICVIGPCSGGTELIQYCSAGCFTVFYQNKKEIQNDFITLQGYLLDKYFMCTNLSRTKIYYFDSFSQLISVLSETKLNRVLIEKKNNELMKKNKHIEFFPDDFNWKSYINLNLDLKLKTPEDVIKHYITDGYKKGLKYK